jgi:glutathione synthase/RimK-type ligase-like ATP-grasp enzyme
MKILGIAGGPVRKLDSFVEAAKKLNIDFTAASFSDLHYQSDNEYKLFVGERDVSEFGLIYIRVVGKRVEDAALLANYAKGHDIKVVDKLYTENLIYPSSLSKAQETAKLTKAGVPIPKTIYGSLDYLREVAPKEFGYPFVIKSTTGKKAREVWAPKDEAELEELYTELRALEKQGARYFAQEFLKASKRYRVFVMGGQVISAVVQPTKWRKRFIQKVDGEFPEGDRGKVENIPEALAKISLDAARAADLDIAGIDVMEIDGTGELLVIEANAAPAWNLVEKYTGKNMAEEILKWLSKQK